jgi:D-alanyl-lipoteichoic acid acyltransferase DltB (MBOAT superfamily)
MLFNSLEFIFVFLPLAVALHFALARLSMNAAIVGTTASSLLFYAWWNPPFVLLPVISIAANFWLARRMVVAEPKSSRQIMIAGIAANLLVLCYYKYADFFLSTFDGRPAAIPSVPLALSFTTFVQIAFLVYVHQRRPALDLRSYALFVAFFPHLIAGPIVRWGSFGRQLTEPSRYRLDWNYVALGLTIFTFGLSKKVLVADSLAPFSSEVFNAAARGEPLTALAAWGGTLAFVLQIFFDFSGYSEMAIGLGLLLNYRLPLNIAAPHRATNLADLWRRWHITLARFLRDFIYVPLSFGDPGQARRSLNLFITMTLGGLWHGANWTFVVWGAIQGLGLAINMVWHSWRGPRRHTLTGQIVGWFLTFSTFVMSGVFFRAADLSTGWYMIAAMSGFGGAPVAELHNAADNWVVAEGYVSSIALRTWFGATWSVAGTAWTLGALAIVLAIPDTMEIVDYREGDAQSHWRRSTGILAWQPSLPRLAIVAVLFGVTLVNIGQVSEFLYYQF